MGTYVRCLKRILATLHVSCWRVRYVRIPHEQMALSRMTKYWQVAANPVNQAVGREILVAVTYRQSSYANPSQFDYDDAAQLDRFFDGSEIGEE